jgi:ABC-type cobalamin/Fe3+-siderophores transport system ATPase subunit
LRGMPKSQSDGCFGSDGGCKGGESSAGRHPTPLRFRVQEPENGLEDFHATETIFEEHDNLMEDLRIQEGMTIVMVSHDSHLASLYADRLLLMKKGCVISVGTPREVVVFDTLEETYGCVLLVD